MRKILVKIRRAIAAFKTILRSRDKGSQILEESLLIGLSLIALTVVLALVSNIINIVQSSLNTSKETFDSFLVELFKHDFNKLWNETVRIFNPGG